MSSVLHWLQLVARNLIWNGKAQKFWRVCKIGVFCHYKAPKQKVSLTRYSKLDNFSQIQNLVLIHASYINKNKFLKLKERTLRERQRLNKFTFTD